jgi:hypothetical protein
MRKLAFLIAVLTLFSSCRKAEGVGGQATIKGKIWMREYTGGVFNGQQYYAPDHDVYLIYGESNTYYDDKISTSYDGTYEFRNLRPGMYKVFSYTKDPITGNLSPVIKVVEVSGKKDVVEVEEITVFD